VLTPTTCGIGACGSTGQLICSNGTVVNTCTQGTPQIEACDGVDNNCNGVVDEDLNQQCGVSVIGACEYGTQTCSNGSWGTCVGNIDPTPEICDGLDNDCDGVVDDGIAPVPTSCGLGACAAEGQLICSGGSFVDNCTPGQPQTEICNGLDDNCDGNIDEGDVCHVTYTFYGFFSPVDNPPTVNIAKGGQSIPVKWRITDANGTPVADPASFKSLSSYRISCNDLSGDPASTVDEYAAGSSGLQNLGDGYWQFNWKTPKTYSGQCRTMVLTLDDGSIHNANFKFK